jgi:hypothetical protein
LEKSDLNFEKLRGSRFCVTISNVISVFVRGSK